MTILDDLQKVIPSYILHGTIQDSHRATIYVSVENFQKTYAKIRSIVPRILTITGIDLVDEIEVRYHLSNDKSGMVLTVCVRLPKEKPEIETITNIVSGVQLYEREVHEFFGVKFLKNSDLRRLYSPENFPKGIYPLLKKYSVDKLKNLTFERNKP